MNDCGRRGEIPKGEPATKGSGLGGGSPKGRGDGKFMRGQTGAGVCRRRVREDESPPKREGVVGFSSSSDPPGRREKTKKPFTRR